MVKLTEQELLATRLEIFEAASELRKALFEEKLSVMTSHQAKVEAAESSFKDAIMVSNCLEGSFQSQIVDRKLAFIHALVKTRNAYEQKCLSEIRAHLVNVMKVYESSTLEQESRISSVEHRIRSTISARQQAFLSDVHRIQSSSSNSLTLQLQQLRVLKLQVSDLTKLVHSQDSKLAASHKRSEEAIGPLIRLEEEVRRKRAEVADFNSKTKPRLEKFKSRVAELKALIKQRGFYRECLYQRSQLLQETVDEKPGDIMVLDLDSVSTTTPLMKRKTPEQPATAEKDAMGRRVWDKSQFEEGSAKVAIVPSQKLVKGPAEALKQRTEAVDISNRVNERRIVTIATGKAQQGGFYCETCDCLLRDSAAYLDHVNGRSHNRVLGMSMRVEKVTVERVIEKMKLIRSGAHAMK